MIFFAPKAEDEKGWLLIGRGKEVVIKKGEVLSGKSMWKTPSGVVNVPSKTAPGNTSERGTSASVSDDLNPDNGNVNEKYSTVSNTTDDLEI